MMLAALALAASAPSFDCAKATTKIEKMICADAELAAVDRAVGKLYPRIARSDREKLWPKQDEWLRKRDNCGDRECLLSVYDERLGDLFLVSQAQTLDYHSDDGRYQGDLEILGLGDGWFAFHATGLWIMNAKTGAVNETTTDGHFKLINGKASQPASDDECGWEIRRLPHDRWLLNELHFQKDFAGCGGWNATVDGVYSR